MFFHRQGGRLLLVVFEEVLREVIGVALLAVLRAVLGVALLAVLQLVLQAVKEEAEGV